MFVCVVGSYSSYGDGSLVSNVKSSSLDHKTQNPSFHTDQAYVSNGNGGASFGVPPFTTNAHTGSGDYNGAYSGTSPTYQSGSKSGSSQVHQTGSYASASTSGSAATLYGSNSRIGKTSHDQTAHSHAGFDEGFIGANQVLDENEQNLKIKQKKYPSEDAVYGSATTNDGQYGSSIYIQSAQKIKCKKDVTGIFVHPFDCSKYINCKNGRTHIQDCGPGTIFSAKTSECDWSKNVECDQKNPAEYFASKKGRYEVDEEASLYDNEEGKGYDEEAFGVEKESETPQTTFNVGAYDYGTRDGQGRGIQCRENATGLFPHPTDCRKFLHCDGGRTFIQDCGPGTAFNAELEVCDWPQNVDCGIRGYDEPRVVEGEGVQEGELKTTLVGVNTQSQGEDFTVTNTHTTSNVGNAGYDASNSYSQIRRHDQFQGQASEYNSGGDQASGYNNGGEQVSGYNSGSVKAYCQPGMTGLNEHPFNCAKFLNCDGGLSIEQNCAPGTFFNPIVKICDFPKNVDCGARPLSPTPKWNPQYSKTDNRDHRVEYPDEASNIHHTKTNVYDHRTQEPHYAEGGSQIHYNRTQTNYFSPEFNYNANKNFNASVQKQTNENEMPPRPLIRDVNPIQFNFSDQNVDNLKRDQNPYESNSGVYNKHTETQSTLNTIGSLSGDNSKKHPGGEGSFKIPDMSKVPLSQFPGSKYPVAPLEPSTTQYNSSWWSNKRVSQGGDVQTDNFDLDSKHVASIWPFRKDRYPASDSNSETTNTESETSITRTSYFPPRVAKNFSTSRQHITPIFFRSTTTPSPITSPGHDANYNIAYYKPSTEKPFSPDAQTDYLPISEALKFLMRPYVNKNNTDPTTDIHQNHTKTMEEVILNMADKNKNYRTDHTVSLEQDSLATAHFDESSVKHPEPNSDDEIPAEVTGMNDGTKTNTFHHDHNCNHYHPPHIAHKFPPNFQHTAEFHKHDRDRKHWPEFSHHHPQTDNTFADNANGDQSISGSNFHHSWHYHHRHPPRHHHHQNPPNPRDPNFRHDPNHPIHRGFHHNHHPHHPNGVESTVPDTTSAMRPKIDPRLTEFGPTEPTQFHQTNDGRQQNTDVESVVPCNQFDCQNGLCLPFSKVSRTLF